MRKRQCCGFPDWNYSRDNSAKPYKLQKRTAWYTWRYKQDIKRLLNFEWARAEGYNANSSERRAKFYGMTMADYMRWLWNNPQAGQSPYKLFEGILVPTGNDENGDIVYALKE